VDCGKFLVLALAGDMRLILPNASSCIGGQVDGMVVENNGSHALTIVGDQESNDQLVGNYAGLSLNKNGSAFGPHANVPVGFGFSLLSTGTKWCIHVSGSLVESSYFFNQKDINDVRELHAETVEGTLTTGAQPNITSVGNLKFTMMDSASILSTNNQDINLSPPLDRIVLIKDMTFSSRMDQESELPYATISTETCGIKLMPLAGHDILMVTQNVVCSDTVTATTFVGQIGTSTQNGIESIRDVCFETDPSAASIRSSAGKDLELSCPSEKKIVVNGKLEINGEEYLSNTPRLIRRKYTPEQIPGPYPYLG